MTLQEGQALSPRNGGVRRIVRGGQLRRRCSLSSGAAFLTNSKAFLQGYFLDGSDPPGDGTVFVKTRPVPRPHEGLEEGGRSRPPRKFPSGRPPVRPEKPIPKRTRQIGGNSIVNFQRGFL